MLVYDILLYWALMLPFEVYLLGIFVIVGSCEIFMHFHSLSHSRYAFRVLRVHVRVLWDPMLLGSWLICIRYEIWVTFLLRSLNHCLIHHSIMGDMIYLCCTDMHCSSFLFTFLLHSFEIPSFLSYYLFPFFIPFRHLYTFPIRHLSSHHLHDFLMAWPLLLLSCFIIDILIDSS